MKSLLLTTGFCLFALLGCSKGSEPEPQQTTQPETTQPTTNNGQKTYIVSTYPQYAPYEYLDEHGNIIGFDVDMINAIAQSQNINIEIKGAVWADMLDELNQDKTDLVISGISRQQSGGEEKFTLSNAYLHGRDAILTKETTTHINTMNDMVTANMGAQVNTIFADELIRRKEGKNSNLQLAETSFMAFKDLINDKVEGVYAHENILRHYSQSQPQLKFRFSGTGEGFQLYDMVVVAKKGNTELINKINAGIAQVHQDGTYQKLHVKWFGIEPPMPATQ